MQYGHVKMWDSQKGYGFIVSDDDELLFTQMTSIGQLRGSDFPRDNALDSIYAVEMKGDKAILVRVL